MIASTIGVPVFRTTPIAGSRRPAMIAPTMPTMMLPTSPKPIPVTMRPASQPAIAPTMSQTMMLVTVISMGRPPVTASNVRRLRRTGLPLNAYLGSSTLAHCRDRVGCQGPPPGHLVAGVPRQHDEGDHREGRESPDGQESRPERIGGKR